MSLPLNFRVVDAELGVYRSGQPLPGDWDAVAALPVDQVLKLNTEMPGTDAEWAVRPGKSLFFVPMPWWQQVVTQPDYQEVVDAVGFIEASPTLVHCTHGVDRTGLVVALWRVGYQGWTPARAEAEWKSFGGDELVLPGLQKAFADLAPYFQNRHANYGRR